MDSLVNKSYYINVFKKVVVTSKLSGTTILFRRCKMNLDSMLTMLYDKDTSQAFENLKELEQLSDNSN